MQNLIEICKQDDIEKFRELFCEGLSIDFKCPKCPFIFPDILRDAPPICCLTAFFSATNCLRYLIVNDCNFNALDKKLRNIVHFACATGSVEVIELLLTIDLDWNVLDYNGNTCVHYSITFHNQNALFLLWCSKNIDLSTINARRNSFLHLATACEDIEIITFLCENGCDVNCKNDRGQTPLHLAAQSPNMQVIQTLIHYGGDASIKDNTGILPCQLASLRGHQHIYAYLLSC